MQVYREKVKQSGLEAGQQALYLETLANGLEGYTYFEE
jgi:arginine decarboxylase-like protein